MADNETDDIISQADIERLLADAEETAPASDGEAAGSSEAAAPEAADAISQDDIDSLLASTDFPAGKETDAGDEDEAPVDVISQDDIDSLLASAEEDENDAEIDGQAADAADTAVQETDAPDPVKAEDGSGDQKRSNFLSQSEIDGLLAEEPPEAAEEDDTDMQWGRPEDTLADEPGIDTEDDEAWSELEETESTDASVTAAVGEEAPASVKKAPDTVNAIQRFLGKKWVWAGAAGCLLIGVVAAVMMMVMAHEPRQRDVIPLHPIASAPADEAPGEGQAAPVPVSIQLNGFLILAPDDNQAVTYIEADVSIYLSDGVYAQTIRGHQPLFRDLVFQEVRKAMNARNWREETEMDRLKTLIKKAIEQSLPEEAVRRVFLTSLRVV